jgi:hypothetical protein
MDYELMEDKDLLDRIAPTRGREPFWSTSEADLRTVEAIRKRYPNKIVYVKGKMQPLGDDEEDLFDEGVSARYPAEAGVVDTLRDPEVEEVGIRVYSRPRWQVKYMMAKAKFMLVTEENSMRREELKAVLKEEEGLAVRTT